MNQKRKQSKKAAAAPQRIKEGEVSFRLLCPASVAGGLIGHSGSVIKSLELQTSGKITVDDALSSSSPERLVHVIGPASVDTSARLNNSGDESFHVSVGQEVLLRVYERILEVEAGISPSSSVRCCRLLAVRNQIGAMMGREGKRIDKIRRESGAFIRVVPADKVPHCADPGEEVIQITGDSIAVRKALIAVSKCLQDNPPKEKASAVVTAPSVTSSYRAFQHPPMQSYPSNESSSTPFPGNVMNSSPVPYSSLTDRDLYANVDGSTKVEVVFRMLCSYYTAGRIIGTGGSLVKAMQEETGASICFAAAVAGCHERTITISALENVESHQSPAQNAVLKVFARAIESLISKRNNGEGLTATVRLLIPSNQAGGLIGVRGTVVSDLQKITGTRVLVLEGNHVPRCASNDEKVVQISGDYVNVQNALIEITGKLRERMFSSKGLNVVQTSASYPVPKFMPSGRVENGAILTMNGTYSLAHKLENLNLSQDADGFHIPLKLPHQNFAGQTGVTTSTEWEEDSSEDSSATVTNMTVEVVVPQNIFSSVFDSDGDKLARLREISGAIIEVQHPSPGNEGKVIITGTPTQTLSGRSILQLYIVSAK